MLRLLRLAALLLVVSAACHSARSGNAEPENQTRAKIENRASVDMDIFIRRNDGRGIPLGFVPGNETATFALPPSLTAGAAWVRFEARPARAAGSPVASEPFPVRMGEEISWAVPPQ